MTNDPIVAEVRKIRKAIEAECGNNMHEIFKMAFAYQNQSNQKSSNKKPANKKLTKKPV